jgi:uncharacterized protein YyaL (SSP411 family)
MNDPHHLAALAARGGRHTPRTRHLGADGRPKYTNALIHSTSPYLLQHAHNPVDWQPWGEAAFAEAARRNVPVFLSVGYSTCHWCHVMEHESFEDEAIATLLNTLYVPVKLDREERPDIDAVYMEFVQLTTGHGGWPMSVWLTPEKRPLFAGTYFPARTGDRGNHPGFLQILQGLATFWQESEFQQQAQPALDAMGQVPPPAPTLPGQAPLEAATQVFKNGFDPRYGGFTRAPKFPRPAVLDMLMRQWHRTGDPHLLAMVESTLEGMYLGGLYDHVGGGFARYSVDARWRVPHFEKMLYDNAQLICSYLQAFSATGRGLWRLVATEVLDYLVREMSDPAGGFWSATDADSPDAHGHGHEGLFFTWTPAELEAVLGGDDADWVCTTFGITEAGDFEGRGVLHLGVPLGPEAFAHWASLRTRLYAARAQRPPPGLDDKVITAWNGLAISAFARAGRVLGAPHYTTRAIAAADFVLRALCDATGRLHRAWRHGQAGHPGMLEDHAALVVGLLDLLEATGDVRWLQEAKRIFSLLDAHFADPDGGYFRAPADGEALLFREKPDQDGAEPSGNTLAARAAWKLAVITEDPHYRQAAEGIMRSLAGLAQRAPHALPGLLCTLADLHTPPRLVVVVTPDDQPPTALLAAAATRYLPELTVLFGPADGPLAQAVPAFAHRPALQGAPTAYHCRGTTCDLPTADPAALAALLS